MLNSKIHRWAPALPVFALVIAALALTFWWRRVSEEGIKRRVPGTDQPPGADASASLNPVLAGKLVQGAGLPSALPGEWPQFRGLNRDGIGPDHAALARSWDAGGPRELWAVDCGEGYAGVAVHAGRVYLMDYDRERKQSALRCLSLADGAELWRYAYPLSLKRNHGVTRTVPAVTDKFVVAMDARCNVVCLDAASGELRWGLNLVHEFGAVVPPWYTGQCPLIDGDNVVLAPGGRDALLLAVNLQTGKPVWQTPNPRDWKMTHSSVMPMEFAGRRFYVYCASGGVAGVSAGDGALLWETNAWKISIATIPSPVSISDGRIFLCGGYNSGSMMLQLVEADGKLTPKVRYRLAPEVFGSTQHTPVLLGDHLYGVRPSGQFVCLDLDGKEVWASPLGEQFGLGPFLTAGGLFYVMNDSGKLSLFETSPTGLNRLAQAQVLHDHESWGPMALAGGRLLVRDFTRLACLDVSAR